MDVYWKETFVISPIRRYVGLRETQVINLILLLIWFFAQRQILSFAMVGYLNIQDLPLSCIQLVPTFFVGYMSNANFSQKSCAEIFPAFWCTLATFILCRNLTHDSIKSRKPKLSIRQRKHNTENLIWNNSSDTSAVFSREWEKITSSNYKGRHREQKETNFRMDCVCSRKVWLSRSLPFAFVFEIT